MKPIIYVLFALLFFSCSETKNVKTSIPEQPSYKPIPSWLESRPFDGAYYTGIARVSKSMFPTNFAEEAKKKGLDDLSSEIEVKLESNSILYTFETKNSHKEDFVQSIKLSSKLELENYELVDVYDSDKEYAVYYRINKADYLRIKKEREEKAVAASKVWLSRATEANKLNDWQTEIKNYGFAINEIRNHFKSVLKTEIDGETVFYGNYLFEKLQNVINRLTVEAKSESVRVAYGFETEQNLAQLTTKLYGSKASQIPLIVHFEDGLNRDRFVSSDLNGVVNLPSIRTSKPDQIQLRVELNVKEILDCESGLEEVIASSLNLPGTKILISSETPRIYLKLKGYKFNGAIHNELLEAIRRQGLLIELEAKKADLTFEITTVSREGGEYQGLFTSYLEVSSKVLDNSGNEIYFKKYSDLKGVDLNYSGALKKASQSFSKKFGYEIMPHLKSKLSN